MPGLDLDTSAMLSQAEEVFARVVLPNRASSGTRSTVVDTTSLTADDVCLLPCTRVLLQAISTSSAKNLLPGESQTRQSTLRDGGAATVGQNIGLQKLLLHHVGATMKLSLRSVGHFNNMGKAWDSQLGQCPDYIADIITCGRLAVLLQEQPTDLTELLKAVDVNYATVNSVQEFLEWYQASQDDVIRIREQTAESKPSRSLCGSPSTRTSKANRMAIRVSKGSFQGQKGASKRQDVAMEAANSEMQLAAHTFVQLMGRSILQRAWVILAVIQGLPEPPPCRVVKSLILEPFLACVRDALSAFLEAPTDNLSAFVVEIQKDHANKKFRRLHDAQFTPGGLTYLRTRHYSVLRIISTIYSDCTDFLSGMEELLSHFQWKDDKCHCTAEDLLDREFRARAQELQHLVRNCVRKAIWSSLRDLKLKTAVCTVEVDVWPPLSECEQVHATAICGEHFPKYEDQPRLLESVHHKAIMTVADFLWRIESTPYPVRAVLFNTCISEARSLVRHLEHRVKGQYGSCPNVPWLAISAILCFRRRIRSIVLPKTFMKLMWDVHPASDAHFLLSQLSTFLKDVDDCLMRAEEDIFLSRLALLHTTVVASLRNAYVYRRRVGFSSRQLPPSAALLHWRVAIRSLLHRLLRTLPLRFVADMLMRLLRKNMVQFHMIVGQQQYDTPWSTSKEQRAVDTMLICSTVYRLCQKLKIHGFRHRDNDVPAEIQLDSADSFGLSCTCRNLAMQVALRTCADADFAAAWSTPNNSQEGHLPPQESNASTWEWLTGADPEVPCSVIDVSSDTADVVDYFGRWEQDDCTLSWADVCKGVVAAASREELEKASVDRE